MQGKIQVRFAILAALAALVAVIVPATLAAGSHDGSPGLIGGEQVVSLRVTNQVDQVQWTGGNEIQSIQTANNDCTVVNLAASPAPQMLELTSVGGSLGHVKNSLGVQSLGDGNGEPCSRVESEDNEAIGVKLDSFFTDQGYLMQAVDTDLELKFGATVTVTFEHLGSVVATNHFDPTDASDDGPDSRDGDNWRYFARPTQQSLSNDGTAETGDIFTIEVAGAVTAAIPYDAGPEVVEAALESLGSVPDVEVTGSGTAGDPWVITFFGVASTGDPSPEITVNDASGVESTVTNLGQLFFDEVTYTPQSGSLSLEGGADQTEAGVLTPNSFSQFEIAREFDGEIECGVLTPIGDSNSDLTFGDVIMHSENLGNGWLVDPECTKKPYTAEVDDAALSFVPSDPSGFPGTQARYTIDVTVKNQVITTDATGQITSLIAEYDPLGSIDFPEGEGQPLRSCQFEPPTDSEIEGYDTFWKQDPTVTDTPLGGTGITLLPPPLPGEPNENACFIHASVTPTGLMPIADVLTQVGDEHWVIYFEDDPGWGFR